MPGSAKNMIPVAILVYVVDNWVFTNALHFEIISVVIDKMSYVMSKVCNSFTKITKN